MSGQAALHPITLTKGTDSFVTSGGVLGPSTFDGSVSYSANKSHVIKYTKGVGTLADMFGDQVFVSFKGTGHLNGTTYDYSVKGSVKGGPARMRMQPGLFPLAALRVL